MKVSIIKNTSKINTDYHNAKRIDVMTVDKNLQKFSK